MWYPNPMAFDVYPVTVRGPLTTNSSKVVTFARMFTHDDTLYIAESRDRGRTVTTVSTYEAPEGEPTRPGRSAKWGDWTYTGCGCSNSWRRYSTQQLAAMAETDSEG